MAIFKAADLTRVEHLALLNDLKVPAADEGSLRIWAEAPEGWVLDYWRGSAEKLSWCSAGRDPTEVLGGEFIERTWAGRVFAPSGEVRWRVIESLGERCCRTVFLGNSDWFAGRLIEHPDVLAQLSPRIERYFLWGQRTQESDPEWIELRIPHRFRYPVAGSPRGVCAVMELWCDDAGDLHLTRLCGLEPIREGQ